MMNSLIIPSIWFDQNA